MADRLKLGYSVMIQILYVLQVFHQIRCIFVRN